MKILWFFVGLVLSALVGLWVLGYAMTFLPDRWIAEWWGFPVTATIVFVYMMFPVGYVCCTRPWRWNP